MRVVYSARVDSQLDRILSESVARFGNRVAETTFQKIHRALNVTLGRQPYLGRRLQRRNVLRYVIAGTPFVAYYHVGVESDTITILAIFHGAQDRAEFEVS
jgi:plasmid stabilization system protein ParE